MLHSTILMCTTLDCPPIILITARQRSCWKKMFSQVFVCSQWGRYLWSKNLSKGVGISGPRSWGGGTYTPPVLTSSGGQRSGQYASYWNAFLLLPYLKMYISFCKFSTIQFTHSSHTMQIIVYRYLLFIRLKHTWKMKFFINYL